MPKRKANEVLCTNVEGASRILNRTRQTVSTYIKNGYIEGITHGRNTLIPIADIANELGTTHGQAERVARTLGLPLWRCKK